MVEQIFRNLAARFSYCLFPSQIMNWHRVRQGTVTIKNVSLIAFFRRSEDGHTRRDDATNVNERQCARSCSVVHCCSLHLPRKFLCFLLLLRRVGGRASPLTMRHPLSVLLVD